MKEALAGAALAFLFIALPAPAFAANATFFGPIVPEECHCYNQPNPDGGTITTAPDYGCVLQVIQNAINFAISMSLILFVIYLAYAGFRMVISGGSAEARSQAKTRLLNVFVGLAVLLCSWLIVDFVMKSVGYDTGSTKFGPWNAILAGSGGDDRCIVATKSTAITSGELSTATSSGTGTNGTNATTVSAGAIPSSICSAASAYKGNSTAAGPDGGNKACAWAVNNVLTNAGVQTIGGNSVLSMENALKGGRGQLESQSQAVCGDIVIEAGDGHVGICLNTGCSSVISNSSSKATFTWTSSITFAPSYSDGSGRIYRVTN